MGDSPGNWRIQRGARNLTSTNEPYLIWKNRDESAVNTSKLDCNCITFTIWVKINGGNRNSEEMPAEVITSVFIGRCVFLMSVLELDKKCKPDSKTRVPIYLVF